MRELNPNMSRLILFIVFAPALFLFQNCGSQFKSQSEILSEGVNSNFSAPIPLSVPKVSFTNPVSLVNTPNYNLNFSVSGIAAGDLQSIECQLGSGSLTDCASGTVNYTGLADGDYQIQVVIKTKSNKVATTAMVSFRKDATPPVLTLSAQPSALTSQTAASFIFTAVDALSGVMKTECALDGGAYAACVSPSQVNGLSPGLHSYLIRATDKAGNQAAMPPVSWTVDLSAPTVNITQSPSTVTNSTAAAFAFSGTGIVSYECQLDSGVFTACNSPQNLSALGNGTHIYKVRGKNAAGTLSSATSYSWLIDTVAPGSPTVVASVLTVTNATSATFNLGAVDNVGGSGLASYKCSLDSRPESVCGTTFSTGTLGSGNHIFSVKAVDTAGNISVAKIFSWIIDLEGPRISLTSKPGLLDFNSTATFAFTLTDDGGVASVLCSWKNLLVGSVSSLVDCSSGTIAFAGLIPGNYQFAMQARDKFGQETDLTYNWDIDLNSGTPVQFKTISMADWGAGCGVTVSGGVKCWGNGILGNGASAGSMFPVDVIDSSGAKAVSAAGSSCLITASDTVKCWGANVYGGTGQPASAGPILTPQDVPGLSGVRAIAAGNASSCALLADNSVKCWGDIHTKLNTPTALTGFTNMKSIQQSDQDLCGVPLDGGVGKCRDLNQGLDLTLNAGFAGLDQLVAVGRTFICGLTANGDVMCGRITNGAVDSPSVVPGLTTIKQFSVMNSYDLCGIDSAANVRCGSVVMTGKSIEFPTLAGAKSLASGSVSLCVITPEGYVRCAGELIGGYNTITTRITPTPFTQMTAIKDVSATSGTQCFLDTSGRGQCWGVNTAGGVADSNQLLPPTGVDAGNKKISVGYQSRCVITADDTVKCWGNYKGTGNGADIVTSAVDIAGLAHVKSLSVGYSHACAIDDVGVKCWGDNVFGQLGNNTTVASTTAVSVAGLSGAKSVAAFLYGTCAISSTDTVKCWGYNGYGSLGTGDNSNRSVPADVIGLTGVVALEAKNSTVCALLGTGIVQCWGLGLGSGSQWSGLSSGSSTPTPVPNLSGVVSFSISEESACALTGAAEVYCWGSNFNGQLGDGGAQSVVSVPVRANFGGSVQAVKATQRSIYIFRQSGAVDVVGALYPAMIPAGFMLPFPFVTGPLKTP